MTVFRKDKKRRKPKNPVCVFRKGKGSGRYWRDKNLVKPPPDKGWYKLGFSSYRGYLKSSLWTEIRKMVLQRERYRCVLCSNEATQVHHHNYLVKTLCGTNLASMSSLCRNCHKEIEFDENGVKRDLKGANKRYNELRASSPA